VLGARLWRREKPDLGAQRDARGDVSEEEEESIQHATVKAGAGGKTRPREGGGFHVGLSR